MPVARQTARGYSSYIAQAEDADLQRRSSLPWPISSSLQDLETRFCVFA
jgi:hypothetical protein